MAFTLVELLVVIGIIAVLMAILMPVMAGVRRQSNALLCQTNLRQIGSAFQLYAAENRDYYPWAQLNYTPRSGATQRVITWDDLIARYLAVSLTESELVNAYAPRPVKLMQCPEDNVPREAYPPSVQPDVAGRIFPRSYGITCSPAVRDNHVTFEGIGGQMGTAEPIPWALIEGSLCVKRAWVRTPAQTFMAFDMPSKTNNLGGFFAYANRPYDQLVGYTGVAGLMTKGLHAGKYNYLYCDGHVAALYAMETVSPRGSYYSENGGWTRNPRD